MLFYILSFQVFTILISFLLIFGFTTTYAESVPDWVKNTAGWWANDAISETEFVTAIEFLVENGIISTKTHSCDPAEDTNHNGIPDDFENISILKNTMENLIHHTV